MTGSKTSILIAEDHVMVREAFRALLEKQPDFEVIAEASNGREAVEAVRKSPPDVVVMDVVMEGLNGIEATRQVIHHSPSTHVVAVSAFHDRRYVLPMLEAGAHCYILKSEAAEELIRAVRAAARNQKYLSSGIAGSIVDTVIGQPGAHGWDAVSALGAREREVLQLLTEGKTSGEIAREMHISVSTVETHRRNLMRKLKIHSVAELTKLAVREGLTSL